jgi:hypothetical protein
MSTAIGRRLPFAYRCGYGFAYPCGYGFGSRCGECAGMPHRCGARRVADFPTSLSVIEVGA